MAPRIIYRSEWGARPPKQNRPARWADRDGFMIHHSAATPTQTIQAIQNFHMDTRDWNNIAYQWVVRDNGDIYEGTGWGQVGTHVANANTRNIGVCLLGDYSNIEPSAAAKASLAWLLGEANRMKTSRLEVRTHRQANPTACPGDRLHNWAIASLAGYRPGPAPAPATPKAPAASRPAPGPAYPFPLPPGHYFGPADGPNTSVSGHYPRRFGGILASEHLKRFTLQLQKRGWDARKGGRYLTRFGHDGKYGPEVRALTVAFQRDQGLYPDGLPGPVTWTAAFHNPVT